MLTKLTNTIQGQLKGRKYLEDNELDVLIGLLNIYSSACVEKVPKQTYQKEIGDLLMQGPLVSLHKKKTLSLRKERLLGQLTDVAFCSSQGSYLLSLSHFPRAMPIHIARLPQLRKHGKEGQNQQLFKARMETGKRWGGHLPEAFHAELMSRIFLDIDQEAATKQQNNARTHI